MLYRIEEYACGAWIFLGIHLSNAQAKEAIEYMVELCGMSREDLRIVAVEELCGVDYTEV